MSQCLIKNSEYRTKLAQSGISEPVFYSFVNSFVAKYGRFPNLDEIPNADSSQHLKDTLYIDDLNSAETQTILNITQTTNIEDANVVLNDTYTDLEINVLPLNEQSIVNINRRPSEYHIKESEQFETSQNINQSVVFNQMFDKLRTLYGIKLIPITDQELDQYVPDIKNVSAFVHEGNIYINTDQADIDAPIHEMTHILLGSIKFKNPDLYNSLIEIAEQFDNLPSLIENNPNRIYYDILEESFVEEVSKYLIGMSSKINTLDSKIAHELHYNIKRLLDSVLMGQYSVKSIEDTELYNMSLLEIAQLVNSQEFSESTLCSLDDSALHRMLSNTKSELMQSGDLREEC